jgi:Helix-turn-helix domain
MAVLREVLTVRDVALELRCSTSHVHKVINGKMKNVSRLPAIRIGRRKLVMRDTLEDWKRSNEQGDLDGIITSSRINAVRRMEEDLYA